jgi:hypothetical protein
MKTPRSRICSLALVALALGGVGAALPASAATFEGFGYQTVGGQGGTTCHVTNLNGSGAGSLFDCAMNRSGPRIVVFDVGGTIVLGGIIDITDPFLTIDGTTAPSPGITIRPWDNNPGADSAFIVDNTHDVILRGMRMVGYGTGGDADLIALDGTSGSEVYNVIVDHVSLTAADDGALDMTGNVHDVTIQWSFIYSNALASLVKYDTRQRISIHHTIFNANEERSPQVKGDMRTLDFRYNIIYDWGLYGIRLWAADAASDSPGSPSVNLVGNAFLGKVVSDGCGVQLIEDATATPVQRWVADNTGWPPPLCITSNVGAPIAIPAAAQVTPTNLLGVVLGAGMAFRNADEQTRLADITTKLDFIYADGFEEGGTSHWSVVTGGTLAVTGAAAMGGTAEGMQALCLSTNSLYVEDGAPLDEPRYRARFYIDPNGFDTGVALSHFRTRIFLALEENPTRRIVAIVLKFQNGQYSIMGRVRQDNDTVTDTGFFNITNAAHFIEFDWKRSTGPGANNGSFQMWIDNSSVSTLTGLDTDLHGVDSGRMGALSVKTGAVGTLYFDEFEAHRTSFIGP